MKGNRLVRVIVFVLAFIGIAAAVRRGLLLGHILPPQNLPKYPGFDSGFAKHPALTFFHIIPGAFFMILGPFLFAKKVQANETLYKRLRTFFFINAYLTGITALAMSYTTSIGGANETAATTFFALFFLYSLTKALICLNKGKMILFREWLLRSFAIGLAIATTRLIVGAFFALSSLSPHEFFGIAFWIGFTLHLIIVEAWIRNTRKDVVPETLQRPLSK